MKFTEFIHTNSNQCILTLCLFYQQFICFDHDYCLLISRVRDQQIYQWMTSEHKKITFLNIQPLKSLKKTCMFAYRSKWSNICLCLRGCVKHKSCFRVNVCSASGVRCNCFISSIKTFLVHMSDCVYENTRLCWKSSLFQGLYSNPSIFLTVKT